MFKSNVDAFPFYSFFLLHCTSWDQLRMQRPQHQGANHVTAATFRSYGAHARTIAGRACAIGASARARHVHTAPACPRAAPLCTAWTKCPWGPRVLERPYVRPQLLQQPRLSPLSPQLFHLSSLPRISHMEIPCPALKVWLPMLMLMPMSI